MAAHVTQHGVVAGLHRHVQVRAHLRLVDQRAQQRVLDVDHLDARQTYPLHARYARHLAHQVAELEPPLGIAVVADADAGHHHLRLAVRDAAAHLVQDRCDWPRARRATHGRDDAVRAMAVTAVLNLDEPARAAGGAGAARLPVPLPMPVPAPLPARQRTSWSVSAQAGPNFVGGPSVSPSSGVVAIRSATASAVPTSATTRGSISPNRRGSRLTAQPATITRSACLSERRVDWRDFDSASEVMQHVLITCRSASASGTSAWPAASSALRARVASAWETLQPRNLTANPATAQKRYRSEPSRDGRDRAPSVRGPVRNSAAIAARHRRTFVLLSRPR